MVTTCLTCGAKFAPKRTSAGNYCSSECYFNRNGNRVTEPIACATCGTDFWPVNPAQATCSRQCADAIRTKRLTKACGWCGDEFTLKRTTVDRRICCSRKCSALYRERQHRDEWLSGVRGRYVGANGYVVIQLPPAEREKHSTRDDRGRTLEHRYVMELHLGRMLRPSETVHHKNGNRSDNRLENLELWNSSHPAGQRVEDLLAFAREIVALYG